MKEAGPHRGSGTEVQEGLAPRTPWQMLTAREGRPGPGVCAELGIAGKCMDRGVAKRQGKEREEETGELRERQPARESERRWREGRERG